MDFKDYYAVLGVPKTASEKEIKAAYRKLARKHHPDVNPGDAAAELRFKEVNEAYEVLGDAAKRQKYDELGANWKYYEQMQNQPGARAGAGGGFDWRVHTGPEGFHSMGPEEIEELFGQTNPFSDFFWTFFGGGGPEAGAPQRRGRRQRAMRGRDIEHELMITLEEAFHGTTRRLAMQHGSASGEASREQRTVEVRVPAGVREGARLRVSGEGERGGGGQRAGDLYLRIRIAPDARFERRERDLYVKASVPVTTAVVGGEVEVPTLAGRPVRLRVPAGTQSGQRMRVRGHGMPAVGSTDDRGDLYAVVDIQVPRALTDEERAHYEALVALAQNKKVSPV
ncbi:MAG: DnaJ domain-containing protein [Luteitalea sp.]|nr:DnaJ domain-containing protein [Luteitalea sp.]